MRIIKHFLVFLIITLQVPAYAQPARVQGHVVDEAMAEVPLTHATAVWLDGAETGEPPSVRIALTDRPVVPQLLERLREPEILFLADRGEVRGLLLRFAAENPMFVYVDVLQARESQGWRLVDQAVDASETLRLTRADQNRVVAEFEANSWVTANLRFDAPVSYDPVVRRLEGAEAAGSELAALSLQRLEARLDGDAAALARVSTRGSAARYAAWQEEGDERVIAEAMRSQSAALRERIAHPRVAVFRSRTAALGYDNHVEEFALEDGAWKAD